MGINNSIACVAVQLINHPCTFFSLDRHTSVCHSTLHDPIIHPPPSDYVFKPTDRALPPTGVVAVENGGPVLALELNTDSMGQLVAIDMVRTLPQVSNQPLERVLTNWTPPPGRSLCASIASLTA